MEWGGGGGVQDSVVWLLYLVSFKTCSPLKRKNRNTQNDKQGEPFTPPVINAARSIFCGSFFNFVGGYIPHHWTGSRGGNVEDKMQQYSCLNGSFLIRHRGLTEPKTQSNGCFVLRGHEYIKIPIRMSE